MSPEADKLIKEALRLSPEHRAEVIEALVRSLDDDHDDLDDADRARLHAALRRSDEQLRAGLGIPASVLLDRLTSR